MARDLPVPIEFRLPAGWQPVDPDDVGASDATFVAINLATHGSGFTATIVVDGLDLSPGQPLTVLADASANTLPAAIVIGRDERVGPHGPRLTQSLRLTTATGSDPHRIIRVEEYLSFPPNRHGVVRAVLTSTHEQTDSLTTDFGRFLSSLTPDIPAPTS
jgi:hypothetical protein